MSSCFSMYVVPEHWTLKDVLTVSYLQYEVSCMMGNDEFRELDRYHRKNFERLYDELVKQPCLYNYTCTDGDPDHDKIMNVIPTTGRLYPFSDEAYLMVRKLREFEEQHKGKRYICMN